MYPSIAIRFRSAEQRRWAAVLSFIALLFVPASGFAQESDAAASSTVVNPTVDPARENSLWLVSTRHLPRFPKANPMIEFQYWRYDFSTKCWNRSNASAFQALDHPEVPTSILVPGSPATFGETRRIGLKVHRRFVPYLTNRKSIRTVIWTWPSDQCHKRVLKHFRSQTSVSEAQGYYLAAFVDRMRPDLRVSLVGYSFGSRIVTGGLHLLGGGRLPTAPRYDRLSPDRAPLRAALLAAAIDDDWLLPGHRHGWALSQTEQMLVTVNRCDPLLQRYRLLYGLRCGNRALGCAGLASMSRLGEFGDRYIELDITSWVGKTHDPEVHLASDRLVGSVVPVIYFTDVPVAN